MSESPVIAALVAISDIAVITFFGHNLRALGASSCDALGGEEGKANISSAGGGGFGLTRRKAARSLGSHVDDWGALVGST